MICWLNTNYSRKTTMSVVFAFHRGRGIMKAQIVIWQHFNLFCQPEGENLALLIPSENLLIGENDSDEGWEVETRIDEILRGLSRFNRVKVIREIEISDEVFTAVRELADAYKTIWRVSAVVANAMGLYDDLKIKLAGASRKK